ncbi:unnamed protein product [Paramecium sonneborni]|uniref:Uncharacterized protein n=1 Tax=Paramecium sonneborni TaxID=65129 RepID=A0A8S1N2R1_9CILI|nr:unnamed protein product [Paramecium sonneborni]
MLNHCNLNKNNDNLNNQKQYFNKQDYQDFNKYQLELLIIYFNINKCFPVNNDLFYKKDNYLEQYYNLNSKDYILESKIINYIGILIIQNHNNWFYINIRIDHLIFC